MKKGFLTRAKICVATAASIFTLFSTFSSTMAWFDAARSKTLDASSFSINDAASVDMDLYYLDHFVSSGATKHGNYNKLDETNGIMAGYETSYESATFIKVTYDNGVVTNDHDPTVLEQLWPAHRFTFAIAITSGSASSFTLDDWGEETNPLFKIEKDGIDIPISLSWATDIYAKAYSVEDIGDTGISEVEIAAKYSEATTGYRAQFPNLIDRFDYNEDNRALNPRQAVNIVNDIPTNESGFYTVIFFTFLFSDHPLTWYVEDEDNPGYYVQDSLLGNSNCYEGLRLTNLMFTIRG